MLAEAIDLLRCPHCGGDLVLSDRSARCADGHSFDVARQGYLNLLPGDARTGTADTAAMVAARAAFLACGHYDRLIDGVAAAAGRDVAAEGCVVDVGAGTGAYLAAALEGLPGRTGLALDISKHALRAAARAAPRIAAIGCDAWRGLPVGDGVAAVVLSVFAPRDPAELARALAPGGRLVVLTPNPSHLRELVAAVGMLTVAERKRERLTGQLGGLFEPAGAQELEYRLALGHGDLAALVGMGPTARHLDAAEVADRVATLADPFELTVSATVTVHRRRAD